MKIIHGKRALVTGAASGIGRAIALALAREGADLHLLDVADDALADAVAEAGRCGVAAVGARCDLRRPREVAAAVQAVLQRWSGLDILVNNAGVSYHGKTDQMPADRWDWVLGVNLLAPIQLTRELLPALLAQEEAHILNVCSILGLVAIPRFTAYQTSKFGLVGFSESLRAEYAGRGLGVTALCPGFTQTKIFEKLEDGRNGKPMRPPPAWFWASPESVAAQAVAAIRRNRGVVPVSVLARFLWSVKRLSPALWDFASRSRRKKGAEPATGSNGRNVAA
jgi:NAD(P)-dependent dehydrogenase (short-subunit alcohol dehydrogenase family)